MKNNLNVFSATIHVISIHQTNFLSSCLTIHNSSTYATGTPLLSSCVLSPARTISYTLLLSKRAALSAEIILLSAASHHVRRPSQALRPILIRLVHFKQRLSQPPILSATNSLSFSPLPLSFHSCIQHHQQKIPVNGCWCKLVASIQYVRPVLGPISISVSPSPFPSTPFHSVPSRVHFAHIKLLCAYQNRANFNYLFIQMVMG